MDAVIINPFIDAVINVFETVASTQIKVDQPFLKETNIAMGDATGIVEISGDMNGTIAISFPSVCILTMVSAMFGEKMEEMNDEIKDAVGEITNMISGQVTQKWIGLGKNLKASLLKVLMGQHHNIEHTASLPVIAVPFLTNIGQITMEFCIQKN